MSYSEFSSYLGNDTPETLMWDSSLYAMNMFLLPLVNKEATMAYGKAEYSQAGRDIERDSKQSQGVSM